jgi:hypothetical protein
MKDRKKHLYTNLTPNYSRATSNLFSIKDKLTLKNNT